MVKDDNVERKKERKSLSLRKPRWCHRHRATKLSNLKENKVQRRERREREIVLYCILYGSSRFTPKSKADPSKARSGLGERESEGMEVHIGDQRIPALKNCCPLSLSLQLFCVLVSFSLS